MKHLLIVLLSIGTFAAQGQSSKTIKVIVEPHLGLSYGAFYKSLTLTSDCHADYIDGFNFEWGYRYELKVKATKLKYPPEDGSSTEYKLIKVVSKTKVEEGYEFRLSLQNEMYLGPPSEEEGTTSTFKEINDSTYRYHDKIDIVVPAEFKDAFAEVLAGKDIRNAFFVFTNDGKIKLVRLN